MKKLFLLSLVAISFSTLMAQNSETSQPSIYVEKTVIDYGVIQKGSDGIRSFLIMNKGKGVLLISNCTTPCQCTTPDCPREPILSGKSAKVSVGYNTQIVGQFSKTFTIMSNDPNKPGLDITIKGEVKEKL